MKLFNFFRKKSLAQEVIEVFDSAPGIRRLGHNDKDDYDFLMILTLCNEFKGELFQRGIIFTAKDLECSFEQISTKDGFLVRCTVRTKFEARRGRQVFDLGEALGAGCNPSDDLALSTAQTMAYKAMLKRSSMTYGEIDDAEAKKKSIPVDPMTPKESVRVASYQKRALDAALRDSGIDPAGLSERLTANLGFPITCEEIASLPRTEFDQAMKLILSIGQEDLTKQWSAAVVDIKSRKAQPVAELLDKADDIA